MNNSITITQLRQALVELESEGRGDESIGCKTHECYYAISYPLNMGKRERWKTKHDSDRTRNELITEHYIKIN